MTQKRDRNASRIDNVFIQTARRGVYIQAASRIVFIQAASRIDNVFIQTARRGVYIQAASRIVFIQAASRGLVSTSRPLTMMMCTSRQQPLMHPSRFALDCVVQVNIKNKNLEGHCVFSIQIDSLNWIVQITITACP